MLSRWSPSEIYHCALSILVFTSLLTCTLISLGGGTNSTQLQRLGFLCFEFRDVINDSHPITSC